MPEDSSSWYARKMAAMRGAPPPTYRPQPQAQPVSAYQQNYAPQQPAGRQAPPSQQSPAPPETLSEFLALQQSGDIVTLGKAKRLNPDPCPNCGGNLFYADLGLKRRGPPPAPRCFTCGYNDLFEQGLESNWQGGA